MVSQKSIKNNIWKFYVSMGICSVRFIAPIRIIYLLSFGLSYAEIAIIEMIAVIVTLILEIPTGIFADLFGRKIAMIIAYFLSVAAFFLMSSGSNLSTFILGWSLSGAADAFESGSRDALIYDTLKTLSRTNEYLKLKSRFIMLNTVFVIIGSLLGAHFYTLDRRLPWYFFTAAIALSGFVFALIKEPSSSIKRGRAKEHLERFKNSFIFSFSKLSVRWLILFGLILALPMYVFTTLLGQPYLISRGFNVPSLGIIYAIITAFSGLVGSFSHKLETIFRQRLSFLLVSLSFSILLVLMGIIKAPIALILVIALHAVNNYKTVIIDNYLNSRIDSDSRATVLSVQSFTTTAIVALLFAFIGRLTDIFSINAVLIALGPLIGLLSLPLLISFRPSKHSSL